MDLDGVIGALRQDNVKLLCDRELIQIPDWVSWLIWLGQWMRVQATLDGRRVAVVRLPSRRIAAAFTAIGVAFASAKLHDDSLDWDSLKMLSPGTKVFWREPGGGHKKRKSGTIIGLRVIDGNDFMEVGVHPDFRKSRRLFGNSAARSYGITLGSLSLEDDERLVASQLLISAAVVGASAGWVRSPKLECTILTERSSFLDDLEGLGICVSETVFSRLIDLLAVVDSNGRSHGKTRVTAARNGGVIDESGAVTILDGTSQALRLGDTVAKSIVILLGQSEYDDEVEQRIQTFLGFAVDGYVHAPAGGVKVLPPSIEAFVFGLPSNT